MNLNEEKRFDILNWEENRKVLEQLDFFKNEIKEWKEKYGLKDIVKVYENREKIKEEISYRNKMFYTLNLNDELTYLYELEHEKGRFLEFNDWGLVLEFGN